MDTQKQTEGWSLVSEHGATRTYWQPAAAGGKEGGPEEAGVGGGDGGGGGSEHLVRVRVEGHVDCSVMEQVCKCVCAGAGGCR